MTQPKFQGKYRVESTRLPNRNYAANGSYFITICTKNRDHYFGNVVSGQVHLSVIGKIAQRFWVDIPNHFDYTYIDMPTSLCPITYTALLLSTVPKT